MGGSRAYRGEGGSLQGEAEMGKVAPPFFAPPSSPTSQEELCTCNRAYTTCSELWLSDEWRQIVHREQLNTVETPGASSRSFVTTGIPMDDVPTKDASEHDSDGDDEDEC